MGTEAMNPFTSAELTTIIAALRHYQDGLPRGTIHTGILYEVATNGGKHLPISSTFGIGDLCDKVRRLRDRTESDEQRDE